jgi:tetratricopeptide (TPR) repeat protein
MDQIDTLVQQADEMVLAGRYPEAQMLCACVLEAEPDHLAALCIAGNASLLSQDFETAYERFLMAAALQPDLLDAHTGLGLAAQALSRPEEARMHFRQALDLNPSSEELRRLLIVTQQAAETSAARQTVAGSRNTPSRHERPPQASSPHALLEQGSALAGQGRYPEAEAALRRAIAQQPNLTEASVQLSYTLFQQRKYAEAEACCRSALASAPGSAPLHNNLGMALLAQNRLEEAVGSYLQANALDPKMVAVYSNLGIALSRMGRLTEAEDISRAGLELDPRMPDLQENLGLILVSLNREQEAITLWRRALAQSPDNARIGFDLGMLELKQGDFTSGWRHYELRPMNRKRRFPRPRWQGEDLRNRSILVWTEQGVGDTIQFARYLPLLKACGAQVILEYPTLLGPLLSGIAGADTLVAATEDEQPPRLTYDFQISLLSLPLMFRTEPDTIPADMPYITPNPAKVQEWKRRLEADGPHLRVGLVWAGGADYINDAHRSFALETYSPLAQIAGIRLYSLQKGAAAGQAVTPPEGMTLLDLAADLNDFADTAAVIANLDLVISVDTAVAHLAGALGKPVWTLLPASADWRWLLDREDSPWYPTMRLFRQTRLGDWAGVIERVCEALAGRVVSVMAAAGASSGIPTARLTTLPPQTISTGEWWPQYQQAAEMINQNRLREAETLLRRLIALDSHQIEAYEALSIALLSSGQIAAVETCCLRGLEVDPNSASLHNNLGTALSLQRRYAEAIPIYRRANALDPELVGVYSNLGSALGRSGQLEEAEAICRAGLVRSANSPDLYCILGIALEMQGRYNEAEAVYLQGLERCSEDRQIMTSLGALNLRLGDFAGGWSRNEMRPNLERNFRQPRWQGEEMPDGTILVWDEQGLGDSIQFARYLSLAKVRAAGARIILEHHPELSALYRSLSGADTLIPRRADDEPPSGLAFDAQIPLMSLPGLFRTEPDTIPAQIPYLSADPALAERWRQRLEADGPGPRVGLVWAGNPSHGNDIYRSMRLADFAPLAQIAGVRLYSLQKGMSATQAATQPPGMNVVYLSADLNDFAYTAAVIANLDLVITVDTSVAHLAGALGRPVWTLLPASADWRWLLDREDSPWYPTMRLFRQTRLGDWAGVMERVRDALKSLPKYGDPDV